jgi:hypothetical protein
MSVLTFPPQTGQRPGQGLYDSDTVSDFADPLECLLRNSANNGTVAVWSGPIRSRGLCSCGWQGRQRWLSTLAVYDAHLHAALNRCQPAVPLVFRN